MPAVAPAVGAERPPGIEWRGPPHARGGVVLFHSGAWWLRADRPSVVYGVLREVADGFAADGALVANVDYRTGTRSLRDAVWAVDRLRRRLGPHAPICAYGESAGGLLALHAALRRKLACVSTVGAVVTPDRLAADGSPGLHADARRAFGPDLRRLDVLPHAARLPPLQLAGLEQDSVVPFAQARRLSAHRPGADLVAIPPGDRPFLHGYGDAVAIDALRHAQRRFMASRLTRHDRGTRAPRR